MRSIPPVDAPQIGEEEEGEGPRQRVSYFVAQRAYPKDYLPEGARIKAFEVMLRQMAGRSRAMSLAANWVNIGPAPMKDSAMGSEKIDVSGRAKAILINPQNPSIVYVGTAQGGVWKSTNGGDNWVPLTDKQASLAVAALAMDPTHPDTIYAGTGEPTWGGDNY